MALSPRTVRITVALLISLGFIAAGYFLSGPFHTDIANAGSTQAALQAYATKDTDGDGLPDWKEALYGTDPANAHSVDPSMTDAEAVAAGKVKPKFSSASSTPAVSVTDADFTVPAGAPGSVTDEFAKSFFQSYVESGAQNGGNTDSLVQSLSSDFGARIAAKIHTSYTAASVHTSASATVTSYAGAIEQAFTHNAVSGIADIGTLVDSYITKNDSTARPGLLARAKAYKGIATEAAAAQVPPTLADAQLSLIQSLDLLSQSTNAIADYQKDPLATLGAIGVLQAASTNLNAALVTISNAILATGTPGPGEPGAIIVNTAQPGTP